MKIVKSLAEAVFLLILSHSLALAQASRTWVSGVGNDNNSCTRTQPCLTFAGALAKTAAGGEIDALDAGGFDGVTINKAITIDGGGGTVASVVGGSIVVQAGSSDVVVLRNLRVNGLGTVGNGIRFLSGKSLHVENTTVSAFTTSGIDIEKSDGGKAYISNTILENNGQVGLFVHNAVYNVAVTFTNSISNDNPFGVAAQDFSRVTVFNSEISGSTNTGLQCQATTSGSTATLEVYNSLLAHNSPSALVSGGGPGTSTTNISGLAFVRQQRGDHGRFERDCQ